MIIGLTGSIATGKSTVYQYLCKQPNVVGFDADLVVHRLYEAPQVIDELCEAFGRSIVKPNGTIDRLALRGVFLASPDAQEQLERIFHPRVRSAFAHQVASLAAGQNLLADIPLLFESAVPYDLDAVIVVACSPAAQLFRLKARSGLDTSTARDLIGKQVAIGDKITMADYVLWNEGQTQQLHRQIDTLVHHIF